MKLKSFLLGFLICYVFCFIVLLVISFFNSNRMINFGDISESYYELDSAVTTKMNEVKKYDLTENDKKCVVALEEFKSYSNETLLIGDHSAKEYYNQFEDFEKHYFMYYSSEILNNCNLNDVQRNLVVSKISNMLYFNESIFDQYYLLHQFVVKDSFITSFFGLSEKIGYGGLKTTELDLILYVLDVMEEKYE